MRWGIKAKWGVNTHWGIDKDPNEVEFCEKADERVLVQMDDTVGNRKFRDFICELVGPLGHYASVAEDVEGAFDIDTAVGIQLDMIGAVIGLPRQGFSDLRYRVFLNIQVDLILSAMRNEANWTGTHNNILRICRTFIGDTEPLPVLLSNIPPYSFVLSVPNVAGSELDLLIRFVCIALYAGVLGQVMTTLADDSLWASTHGAVVDEAIFCSVHGAVADCGTWGTTKPIGICPA
jgi:hypothetical protein